jgi:hypothetical protein
MTQSNELAFERDGKRLFDALEETRKVLRDPEYFATVIEKGIGDGRALLIDGKTAEAEQKYIETKLLVEQAEASNRAEPLVWKLFRVELAYLIAVMSIGYLTYEWPNYWLWSKFITVQAGTAWFGALGGVTIGLFGLYTHIQLRNFDPKYQLWYICKPVVGAIFGWFVCMVYLVGLLATQNSLAVSNPLLLYVIAFLAGFSERFTIKIVDRIMQLLTTWDDKPAESQGGSSQAK